MKFKLSEADQKKVMKEYITADDDQLVSSFELDMLRPDKKGTVEHYLGSQEVLQMDNSNILAKQLQNTEVPLASTIVAIPVAAHQEADNIINALGQYAKQKTDKPFSVVLYPNSPFDADSYAINETYDALKRSQDLFPNLDFRYTDLEEFKEPTIGNIRKQLWDAALLLGYFEGNYDNQPSEMVGINHDIDTISMSPNYIRRVQHHYSGELFKKSQYPMMSRIPLQPISTSLKYAYDPTRPNLAKAVFWHDISRRQLKAGAMHDAGTVIPFSYYAERGGFNPKDILSEAIKLTETRRLHMLPRAIIETSPRRFADRLHTAELTKIWTEETFGADDNCRTNPMDDISQQRAFELIEASFPKMLPFYFLSTLEKYFTKGNYLNFKDTAREVDQPIVRKKKLLLAVLRRIDESGNLAELANAHCDTKEIIQDIRRLRTPKIFDSI